MPGVSQLESFTAGVETAVDVARIERQLHELWQLAADSATAPAQRSVTRACLFNFVAVCATETEREHATDIISTLTSRHPCRAIVLLAEADKSPDELSASITAHCHLAGGGKQVCCEQIAIHAAGAGVGHLASAVLPLLESDLPTVVWWQGNFLEQPDLFRRLIAVANRVIFDSSVWPDPERHLAALARTIAQYRHANFADLSWTRLNRWRSLVAEFFDDPGWHAELPRLDSVTIVHGHGPGAGLRALLCASWIAAQLEWPPAAAAARIHRRARDESGDDTAAGLLAIELHCAAAQFLLKKNHGQRTVSAEVSTPLACGLPRARGLWPTDDAALLSQELDRHDRHAVYERALTLAAALAR